MASSFYLPPSGSGGSGGSGGLGGVAGNILVAEERKPSGVSSGTNIVGANIRKLAEIPVNEIAGASLNNFIGSTHIFAINLPAGKYRARGIAQFHGPDRTQLALFDVNHGGSGSYILNGLSSFGRGSAKVSGSVEFYGSFELAAAGLLELHHYTQSVSSGNGLGVGVSSPFGYELFSQLVIEAVA